MRHSGPATDSAHVAFAGDGVRRRRQPDHCEAAAGDEVRLPRHVLPPLLLAGLPVEALQDGGMVLNSTVDSNRMHE